LAPGLLRMAQAPRDVALFRQVRGAGAERLRSCWRMACDLAALGLAAAVHTGRQSRAGRIVIIRSLLDTDLYKFTMMQAVLHQHPAAQAKYRFRCRTPGIDLARHIDEIRAGIEALCTLRVRADELAWLRGRRYFK